MRRSDAISQEPRNIARSWTLALQSLLLACAVASCRHSNEAEVIVYASQDQVYAEPILRIFTERTGIRVRAVYDSEAVKTVGLANRLLAERSRPKCDVFWSNEELRIRQLAMANVFRESSGWTRFGARARTLVINTNHLLPHKAPSTLEQLTNSEWQGRVAVALPVFGTTATHFLVLRQRWGELQWTSWCRQLLANRPLLVEGNSLVVQAVGRGEAWIGLTDSDDVVAGQRSGLPVVAVPLRSDGLVIPNAIGVIRGGPNPEAAQRLFEFLEDPETVRRLADMNALDPRTPASDTHDPVDWDSLLRSMPAANATIRELFLK